MKRAFDKLMLVSVVTLTAALTACTTTETQIQNAIDKNPSLVFSAIEKNPEKFMAIMQKAAETAQRKNQESAEKEEEARFEAELKNPLQPAIDSARAFKGESAAPITIVEYSDFQCPFCARGFSTLQQVLKAYPGKIKFIYKNLPLPMHPMALPAAKRFEAIALQDTKKAFLFHDEIYQNQKTLNADGEKYLDAVAKKVGADVARMKRDMESEIIKKRINDDMDEAEKFGISGTPGFIVAGVSVRGAYPFETFKQIIDRKLAEK